MTGTEHADHDVEQLLRALGQQLAVPPAPTVATAVRARLESAGPVPVRLPVPARRTVALRLAAAVIAVLAAGALVASPQVRAAVAELFRLGGVVVERGDGPPLPDTPTMPGEIVADLVDAERRTGLPVRPPAELGPPRQVLVIDNRVVSLVYPATAQRPAIRLDLIAGEVEPGFHKYVGIEASARPVSVGDRDGVWLPGPHEVFYVDASGQHRVESARLAASTLIWQRGGVTYRLEGDLDAERAVTIAESVPR